MNNQTHKFYVNQVLLVFLIILSGFFTSAEAEDVSASNGANTNRNPVADFDGDGKSDISVFRPSNAYWYVMKSSGGFSFVQWGISDDTPVPGDYDGDGKTDLAVHRDSVHNRSSDNSWYILKSSDNTYITKIFGKSGGFEFSRPTPPADYDGDGKTDLAVITSLATIPSYYTFTVLQSSTNSGVQRVLGNQYSTIVPADYDDDGKADYTSYIDGIWTIQQSSTGAIRTEFFGLSTDKLVPADYDGDGKADIAVWRPSNGFWYYISSSNRSFNAVQFGASGDKPTPADYDGDGKTDFAVFRPSTGFWYLLRSRDGFSALQFGLSDDIPIPNVFVR